jgi:glycosyltransferase involved in cell wall biosynthesis
MRIALIAPPWIPVPPTAYGGTEAVIDTLARGLTRAGHEVVLATTGDSTCPVRRTWTFEQARTDAMGNVVVELHHILDAYEAIDDVDLVHDHTTAGPLYASLASTRPSVTTNHNLFDDDTKAIYRSLRGRVPIVAISRHQASTAGEIPIARVIHHGVEVSRCPVGPGGDHLVMVGRMSPDKGIRQAIEIAQRAGAELVIAAKMRDPAEHEYFDTEIKPLLGAGIHYAGELDRADTFDLLGGALALLNPVDWNEPFGLVMIEALACGTPVITTPRGAAPEIIDHGVTGFLTTTIDDAVTAVTGAASLDRHICRAAARTRFSARHMVAQHIALYEDVIAGRLPPTQRRPIATLGGSTGPSVPPRSSSNSTGRMRPGPRRWHRPCGPPVQRPQGPVSWG